MDLLGQHRHEVDASLQHADHMDGFSRVITADLLTEFANPSVHFLFRNHNTESVFEVTHTAFLHPGCSHSYAYRQKTFRGFTDSIAVSEPPADHPYDLISVSQQRYAVSPVPRNLLVSEIIGQFFSRPVAPDCQKIARSAGSNNKSIFYFTIIDGFRIPFFRYNPRQRVLKIRRNTHFLPLHGPAGH